MTKSDEQALMTATAWPFQEARKILKRIGNKVPEKGYVLFETGYGPSGLPHIGTFGEVARTTMVRNAFRALCDIPTRLIAYSDDMDGLRKVPTNIPQQEEMEKYIGHPLTVVPDPFGTAASFGAHNNERLCQFLDRFGFDYEFRSATQMYRSGKLDEQLLRTLEKYDEIMKIMLPSFRAERQSTYSPIMPISPTTGRVLEVPLIAVDPKKGTVIFRDEDGTEVEQEVTGGKAKLQWKVDWAARWKALDVDYEMHGIDLTETKVLSERIVKQLGGRCPMTFCYSLFMDEEGKKISKSKGNGFSLEQWLRYAPKESLSLFMYKKPEQSKKLYFGVVPQHVDEYFKFLESAQAAAGKELLNNPAWHIHGGNLPTEMLPVSYSLLLNLARTVRTDDKTALWRYVSSYKPELTPQNAPVLDAVMGYAINFYNDYEKPTQHFRMPTEQEKLVLGEIAIRLSKLSDTADAEKEIQYLFYDIGKKHYGEPQLRQYFKMLYETLFGKENGPRMGTFTAVYGKKQTVRLIRQAVSGELSNQSNAEKLSASKIKGAGNGNLGSLIDDYSDTGIPYNLSVKSVPHQTRKMHRLPRGERGRA